MSIRPGVMSDVAFMDSLQKLHAKQVGWMPTATLEGKIRLGHVLIAEARTEERTEQRGQSRTEGRGLRTESEASSLSPQSLSLSTPTPLGYLIGSDQYFKRDDVGVIYQLNVVPGRQRSLVGASLLKAQFERSAYGCKLYCCWCAQDIEANRFWEAMGFVPLAFRAGSEKRSRVHIFWQKRIRQGDTTTGWWFPSKTAGGSIREGRIVLPIPPGTHWSDPKPLLLPSEARTEEKGLRTEQRGLSGQKTQGTQSSALITQSCLRTQSSPPPIRRNGLLFDIPKPGEPLPEAKQVKPRPPRVKRTCDPRLLSAARELRDRWLERVNADPSALMPYERYDVTRALPTSAGESVLQLPHAIAA